MSPFRLLIILFFSSALVSGCRSSTNVLQSPSSDLPTQLPTNVKSNTSYLTPTHQFLTTSNPPHQTTATDIKVTPILRERGDSYSPSISSDGRRVAFVSRADDQIEKQLTHCRGPDGQFGYCANIFVYDRDNDTIQLASINNDGTPANDNSDDPRISADGNWVVFSSLATNLVRGKTDNNWGIYIHNTRTGTTELVYASGRDATISGDGRYIAFEWNSNIFIQDRQNGETELIRDDSDFGQPGGDSLSPQISVDGRWVAFWSWDGNLMPGDTEVCALGDIKHSCGDIFLLDRETGQMLRIKVGIGYGLGMGDFNLSLSEDGLWLAFSTQLFNRQIGSTTPLCGEEIRCGGVLSADGRWVVYWTGTGYFIYDRFTGNFKQANVARDGIPGDGEYIDYLASFEGQSFEPGYDISADGLWVVFASTDSNLVESNSNQCDGARFPPHHCYNIYIHDQETGQTNWISRPFLNKP